MLITDQDNALVFENVPSEKLAETKAYFLKLSEIVTQHLHTIGYELCPADMMASNPNWCLSLEEWKNQFDKWITTPSEESIMMCTIFFDYDKVYGDDDLMDSISQSIFNSIESYEIFLNYLARNAMMKPPPIGFFRQFENVIRAICESKEHSFFTKDT